MRNPFAPKGPVIQSRPQAGQPPKKLAGDPPRASKQRAVQILTKREEIPFHISVLSGTNGAIPLPAEWQKSYAILLVNREKKEVEIVCSTDLIRKAVNDDLLTIVESIKRSGYVRTKRWMAKPELISIIYESTETQKTLEDQQRTATKIQLQFDELLYTAMSQDVSDIHIQVRRDSAVVRFRRNGELSEFAQWPVRHARTMGSVIYQVIAEEKDTTFDEMKPQDAIIDRDLAERGRIRVRLATLPAYPSGFDMIMRILKMGVAGKRKSLESLGYNTPQLSNTRRAVAKPVGAVVMAGTTGSGKSTSLNSMLGEKIDIYEGKIKVITVEDPPEYMLEGATQVPVVRSRSSAKSGNDKANPFAPYITAAMRSDPDILMIGEVRDHSTAELLIHAVQSGHQVFTTIHASSAIDIVSRMRSNGIPDDVLGSQSFFANLMYQTLLPVVCPKCSQSLSEFAQSVDSEQEYELLERIFKYLKPEQANSLRFKRPGGCPSCERGVIGRTVAAEVILPDPYMLKCFRERREADALLHYRHKGGKLSLEHGLSKAFQGLCDIRDVEHKLDRITALDEMDCAVKIFMGDTTATPGNFTITLDSVCDVTQSVAGVDLKTNKQGFMAKFMSYIAETDEVKDEVKDVHLTHQAEPQANALEGITPGNDEPVIASDESRDGTEQNSTNDVSALLEFLMSDSPETEVDKARASDSIDSGIPAPTNDGLPIAHDLQLSDQIISAPPFKSKLLGAEVNRRNQMTKGQSKNKVKDIAKARELKHVNKNKINQDAEE